MCKPSPPNPLSHKGRGGAKKESNGGQPPYPRQGDPCTPVGALVGTPHPQPPLPCQGRGGANAKPVYWAMNRDLSTFPPAASRRATKLGTRPVGVSLPIIFPWASVPV